MAIILVSAEKQLNLQVIAKTLTHIFALNIKENTVAQEVWSETYTLGIGKEFKVWYYRNGNGGQTISADSQEELGRKVADEKKKASTPVQAPHRPS